MEKRSPPRIIVGVLLGVASACEPDRVEPNLYPGERPPVRDAGAEIATPPPTAPPLDAGLLPPSDARGADGPADSAAADAPPGTECNLEGRWLIAHRALASAIGQEQASHNWFYSEIRREGGSSFTVTKGLHCGFEVVRKSGLGAAVDSSAAWPSFLVHNSSAGRKGTFAPIAGGACQLKLGREYVVRGATVAHYTNPATILPERTQKAQDGMPGWEDWDGDGNPGVSLKVSSTLASGTLYTCMRDWNELAGTVAPGARKFKVGLTWNGEQISLGRSPGSPQAIETTATPSSAADQHYAWWHRLEPHQATGSDAEICAAIRVLKDQLTPEANQ